MVKRISAFTFVVLIIVLLCLPCFGATPQSFIATDKALDIGSTLSPLSTSFRRPSSQVSHYVYPSYGSTYNNETEEWTTYASWSEVFMPQSYLINENSIVTNGYGEITGGGSNIDSYGYFTNYTDVNTSTTNTSNGVRIVGSGTLEDSLYLTDSNIAYDVYYIDYQYMPSPTARYATTNYKYMSIGQHYLYFDINGTSGDTFRGLEVSFDPRDQGTQKNYYLSISGVLYPRSANGEVLSTIQLDLLTSINGYYNIAEALGSQYGFYDAVFEGSIVLMLSGDIGAFPVIRTFIPSIFFYDILQNNSLEYVCGKSTITSILKYFWYYYDKPIVSSNTLNVYENGTYNVEDYRWVNVYVTDQDDSLWSVIMDGVSAFFDFPIGGSEFTIGGVFVIILAVSVVIIFLKIFAGG